MGTTLRKLGLVVLCAAAGCGAQNVETPSVEAYCEYGAVSEAQLNGCVEHVTSDDFDQLDTNAARYARGQLDKCLDDAGPFCEER